MCEIDQTSEETTLIANIRKGLKKKFDLHSEMIGDSKLGIEEFNGYIDSDNKYYDVEGLCEDLCKWIGYKFDVDCDYSILNQGYEIILEIF